MTKTPRFDVRLDGPLETESHLNIDESELRHRSEEVHKYYAELAERMQAAVAEDTRGDYGIDRMYM